MSVNCNENSDIEIIENRLFWTTKACSGDEHIRVFSSDREFKYHAFCNEFGPVDLGLTYKFCKKLDSILQDPDSKDKKIFHIASSHPHRRANAAYLMGAYCIIVLKKPAQAISELFSSVPVRFRDASDGPCSFFLSLSTCFHALEHAIRRNWFNYSTFSLPEYEFFSKPQNGDLNWIIPSQFLAFSSPAPDSTPSKKPSAENYSKILQSLKIKTVIRLNKPKYDSSVFKPKGIKHFDMHFKDGSVPDIELVNKFIEICSSEQGAVAVHCKAGLGRTGTLIGCYSIKIFKFPAAAFIAWCRLCRPGSILGPQQQFLLDFEDCVKNKRKFCLHASLNDSIKAVEGDQNQGSRLLAAKNKNYAEEREKELSLRVLVEHSDSTTPEKCRNSEEFKETPAKSNDFIAKPYTATWKPAKNATFYAGKNLKSNRIFNILYGSYEKN